MFRRQEDGVFLKLPKWLALGIASGFVATGGAAAEGMVCKFADYPPMRFIGDELFVGNERTELFFGSGMMSAEWGDGLVFTYEDPPRIALDDGSHLAGDCREIAEASEQANSATVAPARPLRRDTLSTSGWQYTRWGMTVDEVREASGGQATTNHEPERNSGDERIELIAPYTAGNIPFTAKFRFHRDRGLIAVYLTTDDRLSCISAANVLIQTYGRPIDARDVMGLRTKEWQDSENGNLVSFSDLADTTISTRCGINYRPLATPGAAGGL